jgi:YVTN family beta-propeller protein
MNLVRRFWWGGLLVFAAAAPTSPLAVSAQDDSAGTSAVVGRNGANGMETPVNQRLTPAGIQVELPGMRPQALAISPDKQLLVTSGQSADLVVLDPVSGRILRHVPLPNASSPYRAELPASPETLKPDASAQASYTGLVFSPDGSRIYMANVNGDIKVFAVQKDHMVSPLYSIPLASTNAPLRPSEIPAGLAVSADGQRLYVALNLSNRLLELDTTSGLVSRVWSVGVAPYDVVLAGHKAYVSNWGGRAPGRDSLTGPAGRGMRVRVDPVRYIASEGSVSVIDLGSSEKSDDILAGLHASALAVTPNQRYVVVANAGSDTLSVIDTRAEKVVETICTRSNPGDLFGAQPNALAFDPSGKTLFVCNGTQNAVAVIQFEPGESRLLGLIPVGWFPGAIVCNPRNESLCVANIKGLGPGVLDKSTGRTKFLVTKWWGSLSLVPVPSASQLAAHTATALANMRYPLLAASRLPARAGQPPRPVPERVGEPSVFKHVIYIIKENRTYDQVLGDVKEGNGDPSLCVFGQNVTPNQHKLVREFTLLDNTYCCGSRSPDGHQWTDSGVATDYMEKSYAGFRRSYPFDGGDALAYAPSGFIWDDAVSHGKTLRDYGEFTLPHKRWKDPKRKGAPGFLDAYHEFMDGTDTIVFWSEPNLESVRPFIATNGMGFDLRVPDVYRAGQFIQDLKQFERSGHFPDLVILWLPCDHTSGTAVGAPTPSAQAADNDLAVGRVVEAISHSRFWQDTCLFAIEDDPQDGWDHVSGYRTTAYLASAHSKRGQVISKQYNQTSLLRSIELILGLPPMNQLDATATPMFDCFTDQPDFRPFDAVANLVPLDQMNPEPKKISDRLLRKDAYASARLPLEKPDQCPEDLFNHILWRSVKGSRTPYPDWAVKTTDAD